MMKLPEWLRWLIVAMIGNGVIMLVGYMCRGDLTLWDGIGTGFTWGGFYLTSGFQIHRRNLYEWFDESVGPFLKADFQAKGLALSDEGYEIIKSRMIYTQLKGYRPPFLGGRPEDAVYEWDLDPNVQALKSMSE